MEYYYNFCGVPFRVAAPMDLWEDRHSPKFSCKPVKPSVQVEIVPAAQLPKPSGEQLGHRGEKFIWRDGTIITRLTHDAFQTNPHLFCSYDLEHPETVHCVARKDAWKWAAGSTFLWPGISLPQLLLYHHTLVFHAAYIEYQGRGVLFTAPSQTGKSTQASLWEQFRGARVLNGDKAGVQPGQTTVVHGMPFCGTSGICENVSLPLRCIVVLSQAKENTVRRLGVRQALPLLSPNVFADRLIAEEWQKTLMLLLDLVEHVPIYSLACTPDVRAVEALEQAMARDGLTNHH